jgi:uncharacterized Ntn-hydrolase superfamily protein
MTFSIAARCADTGMLGAAVCSSSPAVAARCAFARAGIGAALTQNVTDPALGPRCLELMALGAPARAAIDVITASAPHVAYRQLAAVDATGGAATYSGAHVLGVHGEASAQNVACAGNLLADDSIPRIMAECFGDSTGHLGDRLLGALGAGLVAGGEAGPVHSAGLVLVDAVSWPVADLRVDFDDEPLVRLDALWRLYRPQMDDYVTRALDPSTVPAYGVPGDVA